jgi:hypothetical protein
MNLSESERLQAKTPQQRFLNVLQHDFHFAPKVAQALLEEAETCLTGLPEHIQPGQMHLVLTHRIARHGQALRDTPTHPVIWTIDAGAEDRQILQRHGPVALRRVRIQRLLAEAIEQEAVATQEDLAYALHVSVRTIKRDCVALETTGVALPTRGNVQGIGRGQTHKAQIVGRWLRGETYDQIARHTWHCAASIQRYVQAFVRVVNLHRQGFADAQIAILLEMGEPLVRDYLTVYAQNDTPTCRERLAAQLQRLGQGPVAIPAAEKGGR